MIARYVLDTGALISAERGKERALRFLRLAHAGRAHLLVPLPVVAEWWRGRTKVRETLLAATRVVASLDASKAAGEALARLGEGSLRRSAATRIEASLAIHAIVMATASMLDAVVLTGEPSDFERLADCFPGVVVLSA